MGICRGFGRRGNYNKMGMEDMKKHCVEQLIKQIDNSADDINEKHVCKETASV